MVENIIANLCIELMQRSKLNDSARINIIVDIFKKYGLFVK